MAAVTMGQARLVDQLTRFLEWLRDRAETKRLSATRETNTNLTVEFKEKDEVKALGVRWRPEEKV